MKHSHLIRLPEFYRTGNDFRESRRWQFSETKNKVSLIGKSLACAFIDIIDKNVMPALKANHLKSPLDIPGGKIWLFKESDLNSLEDFLKPNPNFVLVFCKEYFNHLQIEQKECLPGITCNECIRRSLHTWRLCDGESTELYQRSVYVWRSGPKYATDVSSPKLQDMFLRQYRN